MSSKNEIIRIKYYLLFVFIIIILLCGLRPFKSERSIKYDHLLSINGIFNF